jgi:hypothetical protein
MLRDDDDRTPEGMDYETDESNLPPMRAFQHSLSFAILLAPTLFVGCATGSTSLEMTRTAGFVAAPPAKMYVEHIGGEDSSMFRNELYKALIDDGLFATERYGIIPPLEPDSAANSPALVLSGTYSDHEDTRSLTEGSGGDEKKYRETTEIHEFRYVIRDASTGEELDANVARYSCVNKVEDRGESFLEALIGDAINNAAEKLLGSESGHREAVAKIFAAALHLRQEKRRVSLFEDEGIPELKEGVEFLRMGHWTAAIAKFQAGAENHPHSQSLHKAYFDLGVAFEYNHEFDRALASLRLAHEIAPQERYADEINHCRWFACQYRWLKRYGGTLD